MYSTNSNSLKPLLVLDFSSLIPISLGQFRRLSTKFLYCNDQGWLPDFFVIQAHNRNGVQFNTIIFESNFKKYNLNRFQIGTHFLHLVLVFTPKDYKCCSQKDMVTTRNISEKYIIEINIAVCFSVLEAAIFSSLLSEIFYLIYTLA